MIQPPAMRASFLLPTALTFLSGLSSTPGAWAAPIEELPEGVVLVRGRFTPGTQPDGNTVLLRGPDGLVVVDTGRHVEHTGRVLEAARDLGLPVRIVVNSHWHLDHVGGNPRIRAAFPELRVLATDAIHDALGGFLARYRTQLEALVEQAEDDGATRPYREELALLDAGPALGPDEVVTTSGERRLAGREVELHVEPFAVTAADLWLLDRKTGVLVAGDLITLPAPFFDTACPERWSEVLARLAASDRTVLIPGHGPPLDRAQVETYRLAFDALLACASSDAATSECVEGWMHDAGALIDERDLPLARSLVSYGVDALLRGPEDRIAERCGR